MSDVGNWVTAALVVALVGAFVYTLYTTSRPEYQAQEKIEQAERTAKTVGRSAIYYVQDRRTGLCFAAKTHWRGLGMAHVPCTDKVRNLIK